MNKYIELAYKEALKCKKTDDVPVGAIIVENEKIISYGHNVREKNHIITGHAEIIAVEKACHKKKTWHLDQCEIYVTLKPCAMCMEVIKQTRIKKVYYLAESTKKYDNTKLKIIKVEDNNISSQMIKRFFKKKRKRKKI